MTPQPADDNGNGDLPIGGVVALNVVDPDPGYAGKAVKTEEDEAQGTHIHKHFHSPPLGWLQDNATLVVVVVGASGDLAKKKTFPSLLNLYDDNLLPTHTIIYGYARSQMTHDELRTRLRPYLEQEMSHSAEVITKFLSLVYYQGGSSYGDLDSYTSLQYQIEAFEEKR
jgi:Glucose-6-phosphate dehydrogenase, NAD binding domain